MNLNLLALLPLASADLAGALSAVYAQAGVYSSMLSSGRRNMATFTVDFAQNQFDSLTNLISSAETSVLATPDGSEITLATSVQLNQIHQRIAAILNLYNQADFTYQRYLDIFYLYWPTRDFLDDYASVGTYNCNPLITLSASINKMSLSFSKIRTLFATIQEFPFTTPTCTTRGTSSSIISTSSSTNSLSTSLSADSTSVLTTSAIFSAISTSVLSTDASTASSGSTSTQSTSSFDSSASSSSVGSTVSSSNSSSGLTTSDTLTPSVGPVSVILAPSNASTTSATSSATSTFDSSALVTSSTASGASNTIEPTTSSATIKAIYSTVIVPGVTTVRCRLQAAETSQTPTVVLY